MLISINSQEVKTKKKNSSIERWKNKEYKDKMRKIFSKKTKLLWEDENIREKMVKSLQGINAKTYFFITPENVAIEITNLKKYCLENGLCYTSMNKVANKKQKLHKGWQILMESLIEPQ